MLENTNIKQFYPGPILNKTLDITDFLFKDPEQVHITYTYKNEDGSLDNRELTYGTEYEVTKILPSDVTQADAALTASTGRVTLKADINVVLGEKLTVYRESEIVQEAQYPRTGPFPAASHEGALDYLTMQNQEQQDQIDRSLKVPISTANFDGALPAPVPARALKINDSGTGFELSEYDPDIALVTTKEYMEGAQTAASSALASQNAAAASASAAAASVNSAATSANNAAISAATASTKIEEVIAAGETALENIQQETTEAITNITVEGETQINNVKSTGFYMQDGKLYYTDSEGNSKEFTQGGGLPLASIYLAPFGIDESKNLGRYLNGQTIIQSQFSAFTTKVKSWQTTRPDLFTTETNWQAEKTASKLGQCGKFVVDDTAGTIRLPLVININGLTDLANCGVVKDESLPNISGRLGIEGTDDTTMVSGAFYVDTADKAQTRATTTKVTGCVNKKFSAAKSSSTYQNNAPVQQEAIQYPYVIVVNTGVEEAERPINNYQVNNVYSYGMSQYYKGTMNNNSWLRSAGQWNPGTRYNGVYDWAVAQQVAGVAGFIGQTLYAFADPTTDSSYYGCPTPNPIVGSVVYGRARKYVVGYVAQVNTDGSININDTKDSVVKSNCTRSSANDISSADYITDYDWVLNTEEQTFRLPIKNGQEGVFASGTVPVSSSLGHAGNATGSILYVPAGNSSTTYRVGSQDGSGNVFVTNTSGSFRWYADLSSITVPSDYNLYYYIGDVLENADLINIARLGEELVDIKAQPHIEEVYVNGTSGYRIWSKDSTGYRYCEQWGRLYNNTNAENTISFLKPYKDTNYNVLINHGVSGGYGSSVYGRHCDEPYNFTTTSFKAWTNNTNGINYVQWKASGYLAN